MVMIRENKPGGQVRGCGWVVLNFVVLLLFSVPTFRRGV